MFDNNYREKIRENSGGFLAFCRDTILKSLAMGKGQFCELFTGGGLENNWSGREAGGGSRVCVCV